MAKKIGICRNYDGDCQKCIDKVEQERDSLDFTCEECGQPLYEVEKKVRKTSNKFIIYGIVVGVIVIIGAVVVSILSENSETSINEPTPIATTSDTETPEDLPNESSKADTVFVQVTDTIRDTVTVENNITTIIDSPQTEVEAKNEESKPEPKAEAQPKATGSGTIRLTYGTYTGDIKNGYPEGQGRLVYSTTRVINKYDQKERQAKAGEYVMGEFQHGYFIQGKHYGSDGTLIQTLMIGVPASLGYENK